MNRSSIRIIAVLAAILMVWSFSYAAKVSMKDKNRETPASEVDIGSQKVTGEAQSVTAESSPANEPETETVTSTAAYEIPFQVVSAGGGFSSGATYEVNSSIGLPTVGYAASTSYEAGIGYWYGAFAGTVTCECPYQCDYDADGFLTALDLAALIDVLFAGRPEDQDPLCRTSRGDFDYDGFPTAIDLSKLIDHLFAGGDPPVNPCAK